VLMLSRGGALTRAAQLVEARERFFRQLTPAIKLPSGFDQAPAMGDACTYYVYSGIGGERG